MTEFDFSIEAIEKLFDADEQFPIDFDFAWQGIGYATKQKAEMSLTSYFQEGIDFLTSGLKSSEGGRPSKAIYLTWNCCKEFAMMAGTAKGKEVRQYFINVEEKFFVLAREQRKTLEHYQKELEAVKLARTIPEDLKKLETLSTDLAVVVKQRIVGDIPKTLNQSFINSEQMQRDLNSSLVANRLGLTLNKHLKVLERIQDTYSPEAYNKLKDMYQSLAMEYNQLIERQSTSGVKVSPEDLEFFKQKIKENDEWFAEAEIKQQQIAKEVQKLDQENVVLKVANKRLKEENALLRELLDSPEPPEPDKTIGGVKNGAKQLKPGK